MKIYLNNNSFYYEIEKLAKAFFPNTRFEEKHDCDEYEAPFICVTVGEDAKEVSVAVRTDDFEKTASKALKDGSDTELEAAILLYDILAECTGVSQPWGLLTGVRPIKLFRKLKEEMGEEAAKAHFMNVFRVSREKTELAAETERREAGVLKLTTPQSFSLYIAIPFCPSRCSYCSFVTASTARTKHLIEPYTQLLCRELEHTAQITDRLGLHLESVYMGGGTPTTLNADQMSRVLETVRRNFDMSGCREFTVEAGRPDTITEDKLISMKNAGVDRISINPQTLDDRVLEIIGRHHTANDVYESYRLARALGFDHINTDLIVGLPGDTVGGFKDTIEKIASLSPESVTVHTLAMKRASTLTQDGKQLDKREAEDAAKMIGLGNEILYKNGYKPYYLYRQSRMVGNLENTGWSKEGREGYYNVFIMDESQSIIACGAGAVTKLVLGEGKLERIFNYKYPYEYINGFDEVLKRREGIERLYD